MSMGTKYAIFKLFGQVHPETYMLTWLNCVDQVKSSQIDDHAKSWLILHAKGVNNAL